MERNMEKNMQAKEPFQFCTRLNLSESTGFRAPTIEALVSLLKEVPGSCIYHHTHRFLQQHEYLSPEPPNDFAYWIAEVLGEEELAERIASIDIMQFNTIRALREEIITAIERHVTIDPSVKTKIAKPGKEFCFIKSLSFIAPTQYIAHDLKEFSSLLGKVTANSMYFHVFEARLRLEKKTNDFSQWIEISVGDKELADAITRLDPYTYALDDLRKTIIKIVNRRIA
jgi:hypothetical protein